MKKKYENCDLTTIDSRRHVSILRHGIITGIFNVSEKDDYYVEITMPGFKTSTYVVLLSKNYKWLSKLKTTYNLYTFRFYISDAGYEFLKSRKCALTYMHDLGINDRLDLAPFKIYLENNNINRKLPLNYLVYNLLTKQRYMPSVQTIDYWNQKLNNYGVSKK